jgi:hypothetical protein
MKYTLSFLFFGLIALTSSAFADACSVVQVDPISYTSEKRGEVTLYPLTHMSDLNVTNLACVLGTQFFAKVHEFPEKGTVGVIDRGYHNVALIQWNLKQDYFLIIHVVNGKGNFIKYPKPLDRIKEILINAPLPRGEDLPEHLRRRFSSNSVMASPEMLRKLVQD